MDTVRMGFFLGELYLLHVVHVTSEISSYMKHKREIYITAGPDFGANLHGKILIIDESLYWLKTSAARFHEHLSESILRLGFKKTKHDPDLWIVDKSSNYEYLAMCVDDILIWRKYPMVVKKSLEKTYMLKSVGIPKYYSGKNVGSLESHWRIRDKDKLFLKELYLKHHS
jgi:hypothetical protein